jgi:hypothetical protein
VAYTPDEIQHSMFLYQSSHGGHRRQTLILLSLVIIQIFCPPSYLFYPSGRILGVRFFLILHLLKIFLSLLKMKSAPAFAKFTIYFINWRKKKEKDPVVYYEL